MYGNLALSWFDVFIYLKLPLIHNYYLIYHDGQSCGCLICFCISLSQNMQQE